MNYVNNKYPNHYYDSFIQLNQNASQQNDCSLRILQFNIRGMNEPDKLDYIKELLTMYPKNIDVVVIGETWVKEEKVQCFQIDGYRSIFSCRPEFRGGGLAVFIREPILYETISNAHDQGLHHIHVRLDVVGSEFHIHAVYRPPSFSSTEYLEKLDSLLSSYTRKACVIVGDINIPINQIGNSSVQEYTDQLRCYNFSVTNSFPTRPASENILDHVVCSEALQTTVMNETIFSDASDHCLILSTFKLQKTVTVRALEKVIVDNAKLNEAFLAALSDLPQGPPEDRLQYVVDVYQQLKEQCSRKVTVQAKIKGYCPWMTFDVWKLIRIKENISRSYRRHPTDTHLQELWLHISKKVQQAKNSAKRNYYSKLFSTTNQTSMWKNLKKVIGHQAEHKETIKLQIGQDVTAHGATVANAFNKYFCTVGPQLASTINSSRDINKFASLSPLNNSIYLHPATKQEIIVLIKDLDTNKSCGPDQIPASFLKQHHNVFSVLLRDVFNHSIDTGDFPEFLKTAKVIPLHKGGDSTLVSNYRPISILSVLSKVLEKLLVNRMNDFFKSHGVLYSHQYGFRSGSSTLTAANELVDDIYRALDSRQSMGVLFLDLKKAFDTIDRDILLRKLDLYGIRGTANDLIKSYLSSRTQYVVANDSCSIYLNTTVGVPQGSNLGPLLFLIYVNDLPKIGLHGKPRLFADDTSLSYESTDSNQLIQQMTDDMEKLQMYFAENLLSLNISKTKYMIFKSARSRPPANLSLVVNSETIEKVETFKYLGLTFDANLTWYSHISKLQSEISSTCGLLRKVSKYLPTKQMLIVYHAFVQSKLQYMVSIWGAASKFKIMSLQTIQNRCLKAVYRKPRLHSTLRLYQDAPVAVLPVAALREKQSLVQMHNILWNTSTHHNQLFQQASHSHYTRTQTNIRIARTNTEFGKRAFSYYGKQQYNTLPAVIKAERNFKNFKDSVTRLIRNNLQSYIR